jgi:ribonuclease P protein component
MLPNQNRLKKTDFGILKNCKKKDFSSTNFILKLYNFNFSPSRFAVVISSSVSKKAVQRNKLKRQAKNIILRHLKNFKKGFAAMIYFKRESAKISFKEMEEELLNLFKKSGILEK